MIEEIPYEDGNKKDILVTMSKEEYCKMITHEFVIGLFSCAIGIIIGLIL